jgi:DNA-binding transcriptional MerR regulator
MSEPGDLRLSIRDLSARTGVSIRTIRYYLAAGLLPSPGARGKSASYGEEHLLRLRLVRRLVDQRVPLTEIRDRLEALSVEELRVLLAEEETHQARLAKADRAGTPREYVATLLERARTTSPREPAEMSYREPTGMMSAASVRRRALRAASRSRDVLEFHHNAAPMPAAPWPEPQPDEDRLRWRLAPGIELTVEREVYARDHRLIGQLLRVARALLSELEL